MAYKDNNFGTGESVTPFESNEHNLKDAKKRNTWFLHHDNTEEGFNNSVDEAIRAGKVSEKVGAKMKTKASESIKKHGYVDNSKWGYAVAKGMREEQIDKPQGETVEKTNHLTIVKPAPEEKTDKPKSNNTQEKVELNVKPAVDKKDFRSDHEKWLDNHLRELVSNTDYKVGRLSNMIGKMFEEESGGKVKYDNRDNTFVNNTHETDKKIGGTLFGKILHDNPVEAWAYGKGLIESGKQNKMAKLGTEQEHVITEAYLNKTNRTNGGKDIGTDSQFVTIPAESPLMNKGHYFHTAINVVQKNEAGETIGLNQKPNTFSESFIKKVTDMGFDPDWYGGTPDVIVGDTVADVKMKPKTYIKYVGPHGDMEEAGPKVHSKVAVSSKPASIDPHYIDPTNLYREEAGKKRATIVEHKASMREVQTGKITDKNPNFREIDITKNIDNEIRQSGEFYKQNIFGDRTQSFGDLTPLLTPMLNGKIKK